MNVHKINLAKCLGLMLIMGLSHLAWSQKVEIKKPEKYFNHEDFLYAMSDGKDYAQAQSNALARLSESIMTSVKSSSNYSTRNTQGSEEEQNSFYEEFISDVEVNSENVLYNVKYTQSYQKKGVHYVYAFIPIQETEEIVKGLLADNENKISELMNKGGESTLQKLSVAVQQASLAKENEKMRIFLGVLNPENFETGLQFSFVQMNAIVQDLKSKMIFDLSSVTDEELRSQLGNAIVSSGYQLGEENQVFQVLSNVTFNEVKRFEDMKTVKWNLNLMITEGDKEVFSVIKSGIKDHYTVEEAKASIYKKIESVILSSKEFKSTFCLVN